MKSTDASLESHVRISVPSCVERWAVWGGCRRPPPCPQAIDDKGSGLRSTLQHRVADNSIPRVVCL